jgi:hypothetical protein
MEDKIVYIIPKIDKPIKMIFDELPCPVNPDIRCKYAKSKVEDMIFSIECQNTIDCKLI